MAGSNGVTALDINGNGWRGSKNAEIAVISDDSGPSA